MDMKTISMKQAVEMIEDSAGRFITVEFARRTEGKNGEPVGSIRTMNARTGVKKHLKGGELAYNPRQKGLIPVWSVDANGYRMIPVEGITAIRFGNESYTVREV